MTAPSTADRTNPHPPLHQDVTPANRMRISVPGLLTLLALFVLGALFAAFIS